MQASCRRAHSRQQEELDPAPVGSQRREVAHARYPRATERGGRQRRPNAPRPAPPVASARARARAGRHDFLGRRQPSRASSARAPCRLVRAYIDAHPFIPLSLSLSLSLCSLRAALISARSWCHLFIAVKTSCCSATLPRLSLSLSLSREPARRPPATMKKEEDDLESPLLADVKEPAPAPADGSAKGCTYALVCALLASVTSIIYGYSKPFNSLAAASFFLAIALRARVT